MSDKIARLGIERDNNLMYYIKNGDVWATPRKQKGQPKGKARKIAETGIELDYSRYIYFLDGDGDVARKARALGGGRVKKAKAPASSKGTKSTAVPSTPKRTGKKTVAQLEREIEECLAQVNKGANGNGNGAKNGKNGKNGNGAKNGNGIKSSAKPVKRKKKRR